MQADNLALGHLSLVHRYWSSRRYASAASTDTASFNITDTQTYVYCQVVIINGIIDNITDIISLPSWQYLLMPMSLLPMRGYTYITVSVVLLTMVTISLTCRHRLTYIAVSVVLLVIYHRHADIGPSVMSVVLLIIVTISVTIFQYIYIAVSAVIIPLDGDVKSTYIAMLILFIDSGDNINTPIY